MIKERAGAKMLDDNCRKCGEILSTPAAFLDFKELIIRAISNGVVGTRKIDAGVDFPNRVKIDYQKD